jgi:hypothetical protein
MTNRSIHPKSIWCFFKEDSDSEVEWEALFMQFTGDDIDGSILNADGFVIDQANYLLRNPHRVCDTLNVTSANKLYISIPYQFDDNESMIGKFRSGPLFIGELWTYTQLVKMKLSWHKSPIVHHVLDMDPWTTSCGPHWEYHVRYGKGTMIPNDDGVIASVFQQLHDDEKNQLERTWKGCFAHTGYYSPKHVRICDPPVCNTICDRCAFIAWPGHGILVRESVVVGSGELMFTGYYYIHTKERDINLYSAPVRE